MSKIIKSLAHGRRRLVNILLFKRARASSSSSSTSYDELHSLSSGMEDAIVASHEEKSNLSKVVTSTRNGSDLSSMSTATAHSISITAEATTNKSSSDVECDEETLDQQIMSMSQYKYDQSILQIVADYIIKTHLSNIVAEYCDIYADNAYEFNKYFGEECKIETRKRKQMHISLLNEEISIKLVQHLNFMIKQLDSRFIERQQINYPSIDQSVYDMSIGFFALLCGIVFLERLPYGTLNRRNIFHFIGVSTMLAVKILFDKHPGNRKFAQICCIQDVQTFNELESRICNLIKFNFSFDAKLIDDTRTKVLGLTLV